MKRYEWLYEGSMDSVQQSQERINAIRSNIAHVFVGKNEVIDRVLIALISGGHLLIEDVPGLGKTTLVKALSRTLDCTFSRIQFTPDVLPSDVIGYTSIDMKTGKREIIFGAVMAQIVLADEINRTGPKTQSSLLEVMQEGQVTIDGQTYPVPQPFFVMATQNPVGHIGTYPLPESQLDRFLMKVAIGYPSLTSEMKILTDRKESQPLDYLQPVASAQDIIDLRKQHAAVKCAQSVMQYIVSLAEATRHHDKIELGISPRGSLALMHAAMAHALMDGRDYTLPDDVKQMVESVFAHRIILAERHTKMKDAQQLVVRDIVRTTKIPV
jgi:MoxR-like ATPase